MTWWVGEKSYNKVTTGKWHGDAPLPARAAKARPKPTLLKSRVRRRCRAALRAAVRPPPAALTRARRRAR